MMSNLNYNALIEYLGISHGLSIFLMIILFLISSVIYFFYKLGFLTPIRFKQYTLPQSQLLYISYQGSYDMIQQSFGKVSQQVNTIFKFSQLFGIYYDNPKEISNPDQSRAVLGTIVNKMELDKIKLFRSKFPQYKLTKIQKPTTCLSTEYPYFNALSMLLVIVRVYPKLAEQVKKRKIQKSIGILQIYKINDQKKQKIQIHVPLQNLQSFDIWYKPVQVKKREKAEEQKMHEQ